MAVEFNVSTCGGHVCNVTLERKDAALHLADLKDAIEAGASVAVDAQRLYHGLTELASDDDLEKVVKESEASDRIDVLLVKRSPEVVKWLHELTFAISDGFLFGNKAGATHRWMLKAPVEACENSEVLLAAMRRNGDCLEFASPDLKNDRSFILAAVAQAGAEMPAGWGHALRFVPPVFQADREVVLAAVAQSPDSLQFASPEFRADREVVTVAIKKSSLALVHAAEELREDPELLRLAMGFAGNADADATSSAGVASSTAPAGHFWTMGQTASVETGKVVKNRKELKKVLEAKKHGRRRAL